MSHTDLTRRTFLRTGSGLLVAAAFGGCASTPDAGDGTQATSPATTGRAGSSTTQRAETTTTQPPAPAPAGATVFTPVRPARLADTRRSGGWTRIDADRTRVQVAGRDGVPPTAVAAAVRVTGVAGAGDAAAVTVVPAGDAVAGVSPGIAPAGTAMCFVLLAGGAVDVLHDAEAVTVDVLGWFEPIASASSNGRFVSTDAITIADTAATALPFAPSETRRVSAEAACPPDALAVLVQVTGSTGTWTVHPTGGIDGPPSLTSDAGQSGTGATVVPLVDGGFEVSSNDGGHVSVDVVGHVTGSAAAVSVDGLYVPVTPTRLLDTRLVRQPIPDGSSREMEIGSGSYGAAAVNITTVPVSGTPLVSAWGAGSPPPLPAAAVMTTSGTATSGTTTRHAVVPAGRRGLAVGSVGGAVHVVADLYGWFTGTRSSDVVPVLGSQPYGIQAVDMESQADEWLDYGMSTDGRPLRAFRCGNGPRVGLITTGLHGDEHTGTSVLADLVTGAGIPGWTLWLVPIANPDARAANSRFVHEVDMNRDFPVDWNVLPRPTGSGCVTTRTGPQPHSLVESRQLAAAMVDGPFRDATISVSHHDNYNWVAPQSGSPAVLRDLASDYADATGLRRPGEGGSTVPTSPRSTHVDGGFETFAASLGMSSFLVENKAGYVGGNWCAGSFGLQPAPEDVAPHHDALRVLLTDGRLPG